MKYERRYVIEKYAEDLVQNINRNYSGWKIVSVFWNESIGHYVAFLEREVK